MIKFVVVGKLKEDYFVNGCNEYLKRLKGFTTVLVSEVKEVNTNDIIKNIEEEGNNILKVISDDEYVVTLEIKGQSLTSEELAEFINNRMSYGDTKLTFVIGGSNGLSNKVIKRSNYHLSFSSFTYPHQLMRLILFEQIYRAYTIINHKEYHK